jgi:predicted deacylase
LRKGSNRTAMKNPSAIGGTALKPGSSVEGHIQVGRRPDGTAMMLHFQAVSGLKPGPTICLESGLTGDAHEGMFAIGRLLQMIDPTQLVGTVVAVPMVNLPTFELQHRGNPLDTPAPRIGLEDDSLTLAERAVQTYDREILSQVDYLVSFHNWNPVLYWQRQAAYVDTPGSLALAKSLGEGWGKLWKLSNPAGTSLAAARARGIPAVAVQLADGRGQFLPKRQADVDAIVGGITNLMRRYEMLPGKWEPAREWSILQETAIRAPEWGLLVPEEGLNLGDRVAAGSRLFQMTNIYGEEVATVNSPIEGTLAAVRTFTAAQLGQLIAYVAQVVETSSVL